MLRSLTEDVFREKETRANSRIRAGVVGLWFQLLFHPLVGDQERERQRISIEVGVARDAANASRRADLPIGPAILRAGVNIIAATAAAVPRVTGVQVLTIVVSHPGRQRAGGRQIAHAVSRAGI